MVLNELISAVGDWCDPDDHRFGKSIRETMVCPSWQLPSTAGGDPDLRSGKGLGINRKTWSWNAAAALFAYVYGTLAELEYKYVGQDQLIGGTVSSELFSFCETSFVACFSLLTVSLALLSSKTVAGQRAFGVL